MLVASTSPPICARPPIKKIGFFRFNVKFVDEQATRAFTTNEPTGQYLDAYALGSLRIGLDAGEWGATLFVDNLWNERAELGRGLVGASTGFFFDRFTIARPRTIGLSFNRDF